MSIFKKKEDKIVDVDLHELEVESGNRLEHLSPGIQRMVAVVGVLWTIFQVYTAVFGLFPAMVQRMTTLSFGLFLCFVCFKFKKNDTNKVPIYDWIMALAAVAIDVYIIATLDTLTKRGGNPTQLDIIFGAILILLVLSVPKDRRVAEITQVPPRTVGEAA